MLYGRRSLRSQTFQPGQATPMMRLRAAVIHFLFVLSSHLLKMNMSMTKRQLSPQETAQALERCSIISTGNMHSIKEPTEFILQQTGFWENICTTTLLPLSQNISVSKCIKGQCRQSADRCSISSKWQFRHLMFKAVLSMFLTTSMPSAPTFPPASPQRSKPDRNNTNTTGTSYCHLRKRYDRTSSKRDRTMSEKRSSDHSADNGTDIAGYLRKSVPSTSERQQSLHQLVRRSHSCSQK